MHNKIKDEGARTLLVFSSLQRNSTVTPVTPSVGFNGQECNEVGML